MRKLSSSRLAKFKHAGFRANCWCSFCISKKFNSNPRRKFKAKVESFLKESEKEIHDAVLPSPKV